MRRRLPTVGVLLISALAVLVAYLVWMPDRSAPAPAVLLPTPSPQPTETLVPASPTTATDLAVRATTDGKRITFRLSGSVPAGATEALLWYDADAGASPRRVPLAGATAVSTSVTITPSGGLTVTVPRALDRLDFWWAVRSSDGRIVRQSGSLALPTSLTKQPLPPSSPAGFAWQEHRSPHFLFRFAADSAAARDIDQIVRIAEESYLQASAIISPALIAADATASPSFAVYLVPRVFWQGGVAYSGGTLMISYLDRNYADVTPWAYFVHETTHALARAYAGRDVNIGGPLGEGIAVYAAGGHYNLEPLRQRGAALLQLDRLVDLCRLNVQFYELQHEAAYLQSASLVDFLIERYGLAAFLDHYLHGRMPRPAKDEAEEDYCSRLYDTTAEPFGVTFRELETAWLEWLRAVEAPPTVIHTLNSTLRYYDLMREYQASRDPTARIIPNDPSEGWPEETLAQFLTNALTPTNVLQETMLIAAHQALLRGEHERGDQLLKEVEDSLASGRPDGPAGTNYQAVQNLFEQLARARRLGESAALEGFASQQVLAAAPPAGLYSSFEIELQQLEFVGERGSGLVSITSRPLAGNGQRQLYRFEVERASGRWLLRNLEPTTVVLEGPPGPGAIVGN